MMPIPNDEYGFENELVILMKKNMYIVIAARIKLLLDAGLLSVFQHHIDNNFYNCVILFCHEIKQCKDFS